MTGKDQVTVEMPEHQKIALLLWSIKHKLIKNRMYDDAITIEIIIEKILRMGEELRQLRAQRSLAQVLAHIALSSPLDTVSH